MEHHEIILKPSEYAMAAHLSAARDHVNKGFGVTDRQMGQDDGFLIGLDGLVGELGVCKHFNVWPDLSFDPRMGGFDCVINGRKVDVKSTKPGKEKVYVPSRKAQDNIERYIFCYVNFRTVTILGWLYHQYVFREDNCEESPRKGEYHHMLYLNQLRTDFE